MDNLIAIFATNGPRGFTRDCFRDCVAHCDLAAHCTEIGNRYCARRWAENALPSKGRSHRGTLAFARAQGNATEIDAEGTRAA